jgi:hypothetical protein
MPSLLESAVQPNDGLHLGRLTTFLDYIATKLSADDYATATNLLWAAVDPVYAARLAREVA